MRLYIPKEWTVRTNYSGRVFLCENERLGVRFKVSDGDFGGSGREGRKTREGGRDRD